MIDARKDQIWFSLVEKTMKGNLHTIDRRSIAEIDGHLAIVAHQRQVDRAT